MSGYHILDVLPDEHQLPHVPTQLWLLLTLEIVISDIHGESLLLTYPSYSLESPDGQGPPAEGYWTPPFLGYPVELGFHTPDTVGAVKSAFLERERHLDKPKAIAELAYLMGLPSPEISLTGSFIELKRSPRSPELWKCYKVVRYTCAKLGARGRRNLADPECRKGHVFLPLGDLGTVLRTQHDSTHERTERLFLSKPLVSNLDHILKSESDITRLRANAIALESKHFRFQEEGLLVAADLAGYGTACKYATEEMRSFTQSGAVIATFYRESVSCLFYRFLATVGVAQVYTAGDGFIAAIPKRHFSQNSLRVTLISFLDAYRLLLTEVNQFNSVIQDTTKRVGSRLALHYGSYAYGRIALSRSNSVDFDGPTIIEVSRLERALREYTKGPSSQPTPRLDSGTGNLGQTHLIVHSSQEKATIGDVLDSYAGSVFQAEIPLRMKEFDSMARIFEIIFPA